MFYSRSIGEIDSGAKLFGKVGGLSFGGLDATRFGHTNDAVLSAKQDRSRYSDWGAAFVDHRAEGEGNSVARLSYHWFQPQKAYNRDFNINLYIDIIRLRADLNGFQLPGLLHGLRSRPCFHRRRIYGLNHVCGELCGSVLLVPILWGGVR